MRHVEGTIRTYPVERLSILADGSEFVQDEIVNQASAYAESEESDDLWIMEEGKWCPISNISKEGRWEDEDEIERDNEAMDVDDKDASLNDSGTIDCSMMDNSVNYMESAAPRTSLSMVSPASPSQDPIWNELAEGARVINNIPTDGTGNLTHMIYSPPSTTLPLRLQPPAINSANIVSSLSKEHVSRDRTKDLIAISNNVVGVCGSGQTEQVPELSWKQFDILPCAPVDHAFYSDPPAQPGKGFTTRLHREYRALESGLPGMISH